MDVKCRKIGRCLVVTLSGEMDHHSASAARRQIDGAFHAEGAQHIILIAIRWRLWIALGWGS